MTERLSRTSDRPVQMDKQGVYFQWKIVWIVAGALLAVGGGWVTLNTDLLRQSHNTDPKAHPVVLIEGDPTVPTTAAVQRHEKQQREMLVGIKGIKIDVGRTRDLIHDDVSDRIADRAADKIRRADKKTAAWKHAKRTSLANLRNNRPARRGLDDRL